MSVSSVSKSFKWWCAVLTVMILCCLIVYRSASAIYHNQQLSERFTATENVSPYQQEIPMEKMDLTAYTPYFPTIFALPSYSWTHRIETPVSLQYYTEIPTDETTVALEIPKGTSIIAVPEGSSVSTFQEVGYGYTSYPTYERGWRYVRPFVTTEGMDPADTEQYYYVKMDSLEAVLAKAIEVNKSVRVSIQQQRWSLHKGKHIIARYIDNVMYENGAYLSPDLFYRVFDRWNVILLGATGITVKIFLLRRGAWLTSDSKIAIDSHD